jgi:hypothetical protein
MRSSALFLTNLAALQFRCPGRYCCGSSVALIQPKPQARGQSIALPLACAGLGYMSLVSAVTLGNSFAHAILAAMPWTRVELSVCQAAVSLFRVSRALMQNSYAA